jgi:hypothetical protein
LCALWNNSWTVDCFHGASCYWRQPKAG